MVLLCGFAVAIGNWRNCVRGGKRNVDVAVGSYHGLLQ